MKGAVPPLGAVVHGGIRERPRVSGTRYMARARWTHPVTSHREEVNQTFASREAADAWLELQRQTAATGIDHGQTLATYVEGLDERWARTIDPTSTRDPYSAGLRLRVLPALGHLPVGMLTAGLIDRAIDRWEEQYSSSTVKNTVAALVLVLDEAVRDELLRRNPAKDRARRKTVGRTAPVEVVNPRELALPDVATLRRLTAAVWRPAGISVGATWSRSWLRPHCGSASRPA